MTEQDGEGTALLEQFSSDEVAKLGSQVQAHQQMLDSLQQTEAAAANSNNQIGNQLQGLVQANIQLPNGQE